MLSSLFPQWMPPWAQAVLLVGGILFTLVWLLVPFAVFGVKGRLDNLAIQLDDLQAELRVMSMGLNAPPAPPPVAQVDAAPAPAARRPTRAVPDPVEDESDIPAYERRATRPPPAAPVSAAPPRAEPAPARSGAEDWPPRPATPPAAAPAARPGWPDREDEGPSLSEWSRRPSDRAPDVAAARPLRASVWPPERGQRAEPTLRWPPRREG